LALASLASAALAYAIVGYVRHARQERGIASHAEQIFRDKSSFVAGNPDGDVSVVAFLDYNCPYCREGTPDLARLVAQDGKVRLVLKELPVLGHDSEEVARIALAAVPQGKYLELHRRLFSEPGRATKAKALRIAGELGLDVERLEADMNDPSVTATLLDNTRLARDIGVRGVPFYLVGDQRIASEDGDLYDKLAEGVATMRKDGCRIAC
jgi:protein-disulfide isomerase